MDTDTKRSHESAGNADSGSPLAAEVRQASVKQPTPPVQRRWRNRNFAIAFLIVLLCYLVLSAWLIYSALGRLPAFIKALKNRDTSKNGPSGGLITELISHPRISTMQS